ncbi:hypothetical protein [Clostridium sp. UBA6640]|uniref:hypothetical protein n=1 Tax=Clostridium sp. UBA6640 TaxID=1946370 RepID=UPI0025BCEDB8|nr:hypothetical protein [Clostridium sp. UBA6640]
MTTQLRLEGRFSAYKREKELNYRINTIFNENCCGTTTHIEQRKKIKGHLHRK